MRSFITHPIAGFHADATMQTSAATWAEPPVYLANLIGLARTAASLRSGLADSQPIPAEPETPELPDDYFPFSALIRLVRQMRQ